MVLCSPLSAQHHKLGVTIGGVLSKPKNYQLFYGYHIGIKNEFTFCKTVATELMLSSMFL